MERRPAVTRVDLPDGALEVTEQGHGPSLLLLHGFTGTGATWHSVAAACQGRRRVIAPDLLGHGGSDAPRDPARYALERQADALFTLLVGLDAVPAEVVGYSMGARVALVLALRHPEVVARLVLESPSAGIADPVERASRHAADEALAQALEQDGIESFATAWEAQPLFASHVGLSAGERARLHAERRGHDPSGLAASLRGAGQGVMTPLDDLLGGIGIQSLVVAGELDVVGMARASAVAAAMPAAPLEVIAQAGHTPHLEQPGAFIERLARFLDIRQPTPAH
jgi:2-succinyl-6-hydroxy-2,4-cyclohexadiene-1-carboxylate synthase